jgi:hypothetical protein
MSEEAQPEVQADVVQLVKDFFGKMSSGEPVQDQDQDAPAASSPSGTSNLAARTRDILERRRNVARRRNRRLNPPKDGPSEGEMMSMMALDVRMIPIEKIFIDPDFDYARVHEDPLHPEWYSNEGQHLSDLEETMREEGLKDPIEVQVKDDEFLLRAGSRRWKAARKLGWKFIPATVVPSDIPIEWQYSSSIIRNTGLQPPQVHRPPAAVPRRAMAGRRPRHVGSVDHPLPPRAR